MKVQQGNSKLAENLVDRSFGRNLKVLRFIGVYPPKNANLCYKIYAFVVYSICCWIFPLQATISLIMKEDADLVYVTDTFVILLQVWILTFKVMPFFTRQQGIEEILERIEGENFEHHLLEHRERIEKCIVKTRTLYTVYTCCCLSSFTSWWVEPLFVKEKILPMEIPLPFEITKDHPAYFPIFWYIGLSIVYGCIVNTCSDTLISGLMHHVSGQIIILKDNLTNVGQRAEKAVLHVDDLEQREMLKNDFVHQKLQQCAIHYENIIKFTRDLEKNFSFVPFIQLSASVSVICVTCFQIAILDSSNGTFFTRLFYVACISGEVYMYCHFGNELYHESTGIGNAIYTSEWYNFDGKCKKIMLILMERAKIPLIFISGNLLPLYIDTFVSIMRKAYSFSAVLRNYKKKFD